MRAVLDGHLADVARTTDMAAAGILNLEDYLRMVSSKFYFQYREFMRSLGLLTIGYGLSIALFVQK